jgi:hypothetical protein
VRTGRFEIVRSAVRHQRKRVGFRLDELRIVGFDFFFLFCSGWW